jgi:putative ABC transport system ATP-binding protein
VEQIELRGVTKALGKGSQRVVAVTNVNLAIPRGAFLSITGPSGSGKTTLLRLIGGYEKATAGTVLIQGVNLATLRFLKRRRFVASTFAYMPLFFDARRYRTALAMVMADLPRSMPKDEKRKRAMAMLERVDVANHHAAAPFKLSGGEQRRVALARALVTERPIVLAEEPTGQVDPVTARGLLALIREINERANTTFIVVTENEALAREAKRTIRLEEGRITYDLGRSIAPVPRS